MQALTLFDFFRNATSRWLILAMSRERTGEHAPTVAHRIFRSGLNVATNILWLASLQFPVNQSGVALICRPAIVTKHP
jgi:hypothetical protein